MNASHASTIRMLAVSGQQSPSCSEIDIKMDLTRVGAPIPW
jgi:hypothetical protein